jgi:hypothetical protein
MKIGIKLKINRPFIARGILRKRCRRSESKSTAICVKKVYLLKRWLLLVVKLIENTNIRIRDEAYKKRYRSFNLTTLPGTLEISRK